MSSNIQSKNKRNCSGKVEASSLSVSFEGAGGGSSLTTRVEKGLSAGSGCDCESSSTLITTCLLEEEGLSRRFFSAGRSGTVDSRGGCLRVGMLNEELR